VNAWVAYGADFPAALNAAAAQASGNASPMPKPGDEAIVAIFLGQTGSIPRAWTFEKAEHDGERLRIHMKQQVARSRDLRSYWLVLRLGRRDPDPLRVTLAKTERTDERNWIFAAPRSASGDPSEGESEGSSGGASGDGRAEASTNAIPLDAIYANTGQPGISWIDPKGDAELERALQRLVGSMEASSPRVYLVVAKDLTEALQRGASLAGGTRDDRGERSADEASPERAEATRPAWAMVYLGATGSQPRPWTIERIDREGGTVTLHARSREPGGIQSMDLRRFWCIIPLGMVDADGLTFRMHDARRDETVAERRRALRSGVDAEEAKRKAAEAKPRRPAEDR
jgi:hypothetical protein